MANVCGAMRTYFEGLVEFQHQNLTRGLELMKKAENLFASTGAAGSAYRGMVDHMMPEQLFAAGREVVHRVRAAPGGCE